MAVGVKAWSTTASSNANADSNINWAENQLAPTLNNSARATLAAIAALYDQIGGGTTVGGSSNAYTITNAATGAWSSYATGDLIMLIANHTNSGASTLNVDGLGAKAITKNGTTALASGDLVSGGAYLMTYDGTRFVLVGEVSGGVYQPLDATLVALAALSISAGKLIKGTGTDAFALIDITTAGEAILDDANAAAQRTTLGLGTAAVMAGPSGTIVGTSDTQTLTNKNFRIPTSAETSGTLTAVSANTTVACAGGITLDDGVFTAGDYTLFDAGASNRTFTRASGLTMYVNGTDSASATLSANQMGSAYWRSASVCVLSGAFA